MTGNNQTINSVLLLLEDDEVQRSMLIESGKLFFGDESSYKIYAAQSTNEAIENLTALLPESPEASLYAIMDYNMGINQPGNRKPTESLFFNDVFLKYLQNGAVIVIYSGYPEQVRQSQIIYEQIEKYDNAVILLAVKSEVYVDDLFRMLKSIKRDDIAKLKKVAKSFQYDLGKLFDYLTSQVVNSGV